MATNQTHRGVGGTAEWHTPKEIFDEYNAEYGPFDLDPASTHKNTLCNKYFTVEEDGLSRWWFGKVWLNPPYSARIIDLWVAKAAAEVKSGRAERVVLLLPSRSRDTRWWQENIGPEYPYKPWVKRVKDLPGRLSFTNGQGETGTAPFGNTIVVFEMDATRLDGESPSPKTEEATGANN